MANKLVEDTEPRLATHRKLIGKALSMRSTRPTTKPTKKSDMVSGARCLTLKEFQVHYRNGREAKNGDKIVSFAGYGGGAVTINAVGILYDAVPGNDHCNGSIASTIGGPVVSACLCDCLHADDLGTLIAERGFDKRPAGK